MRSSTAGLTLLLTLSLTACNGCDQGGRDSGNGNGGSSPATAKGNSTAAMNDAKHRLVDGAARFSPAKKQLRVALSSFPLTPDQIKTMTDVESHVRTLPSDKPYLELTFTIKDPSRPLSPKNVDSWLAVFFNFGKGPMTFNFGSEGIVRLSGVLSPGGTIQLQIVGGDTFDMGDDQRNYVWSLDHRVPVVGK